MLWYLVDWNPPRSSPVKEVVWSSFTDEQMEASELKEYAPVTQLIKQQSQDGAQACL